MDCSKCGKKCSGGLCVWCGHVNETPVSAGGGSMGNLKPCQGCQRMVDPSAPACPGCGRAHPARRSAVGNTILGAAAIAAILFFVGRAGTLAGSSSPRVVAADQEAARPAAPPIEIAASALYRAYHENEVSADDAYKGKRLLVTGRVASIDKDLFDHIVIRLAAGGFLQTADATMQPNQKAQAAGLHKGANVSVICTGNGGLIMDPQLEDCVLQ